jgi:hypothetical protein
MSNEITAKIGTKLSEAEQRAVDPKKVGWSQAQPPKASVQGQLYTCGCQVCPYCGCASWSDGSSSPEYHYITCRCCGGTYRV